MQEVASLCNNHYFASSMTTGFMLRATLIDQISRKSLRLSPKARLEMTNGRLTTSVSGDCSFLDFVAPMMIECIVEPFTILVGMALLIYYLGYSALVGILVLLM
jgi:ATP-binding cassette subfamily C (CFTR/MRP) protein 1